MAKREVLTTIIAEVPKSKTARLLPLIGSNADGGYEEYRNNYKPFTGDHATYLFIEEKAFYICNKLYYSIFTLIGKEYLRE
jgi:hypothetical protein